MAWLATNPPDLIIHTGDVTLDGVASDRDYDAAAALFGSLPERLRYVPGNHDIGESDYFGLREPPVTALRLAHWRARFGPDAWIEDIEAWRLIGVNAQLLGSRLDEEEAQYAFLREAAATAGDRSLAPFCHEPLSAYNHLR